MRRDATQAGRTQRAGRRAQTDEARRRAGLPERQARRTRRGATPPPRRRAAPRRGRPGSPRRSPGPGKGGRSAGPVVGEAGERARWARPRPTDSLGARLARRNGEAGAGTRERALARALKAIGGFPSAGFSNSTRAPPSGFLWASPRRAWSTDAGLKSSGGEARRASQGRSWTERGEAGGAAERGGRPAELCAKALPSRVRRRGRRERAPSASGSDQWAVSAAAGATSSQRSLARDTAAFRLLPLEADASMPVQCAGGAGCLTAGSGSTHSA